jgi:hypothetical protein
MHSAAAQSQTWIRGRRLQRTYTLAEAAVMLSRHVVAVCAVTLFVLANSSGVAHADAINLANAVIVVRTGERPAAEKIAPTILSEEILRRTGIRLPVTETWPGDAKTVIAISTKTDRPAWHDHVDAASETTPAWSESFSIRIIPPTQRGPQVIAVTGFDSRGAMFAVGKLLRTVACAEGSILLDSNFQSTEAPDRPIRGHQIGYRNTANSWDAWTFDQYEQYFRDLVTFGTNAVENIPWQEDNPSPVMKYPREEMNLKFGELCDKYDLDHWIWVPVLIKLPDEAKEQEVLQRQEQFYGRIKRLNAIFVPGGDPGDNKANVLIPHLEKMAKVATKHHPKAKIWLSLQHFKADDIEFLYRYLEEIRPAWFGGLVMGPGSPPMESTRRRLPRPYQLRWYPDITHTVRCQYPVPWLDPTLGMTLGREPVNPRPVDYTQVYRFDYAFTDGFVSYSDGAHDDFNKCLWSQLGWNPSQNPRDVAIEYARYFFGSNLANIGADGLFALEADTRGSLVQNGSVTATLKLWQEMERRLNSPPDSTIEGKNSAANSSPSGGTNGAKYGPERWRFKMHLLRAYYVDFTRQRLIYETSLEQQALEALAHASERGVDQSLNDAQKILDRAIHEPVDSKAIQRLNDLGGELFQEIGLQTSVEKYHASNSQRGAILDFIDYPLNNRWWLEDQFDRIRKMPDAKDQLQRIDMIRNWENPGEHGYYDVIGHVGRSPRVVKLLQTSDWLRHTEDLPAPTQRWMRETKTINRQAWHSYLNNVPAGITYNDLDTQARYVVKLFSQRPSPLVIDGVAAKLIKTGETYDKVTEQIFEVPAEASRDGRIKLTWEKLDESHLNWRDRHYVTDIWVMKRPAGLDSAN